MPKASQVSSSGGSGTSVSGQVKSTMTRPFGKRVAKRGPKRGSR